MSTNQFITLRADENQARGIGQYVLDILAGKYAGPSDAVLARTEQFHLDSVACGVSSLALGAKSYTEARLGGDVRRRPPGWGNCRTLRSDDTNV